jgi:hypothetical protein
MNNQIERMICCQDDGNNAIVQLTKDFEKIQSLQKVKA